MPFGHTRAQQGDEFPVRLRFAELPADRAGGGGAQKRERFKPEPPRNVLERGLTTADLKARVALKEKASVRPPDEAKLGERQPPKKAVAGAHVYGQENYSKATLVHTKNGPRWVERELAFRNKVPDPEKKDLQKWTANVRAFRKKQRDEELKAANEKLKEACRQIQKKESAIVQAELRPAPRAQKPQVKPRKQHASDAAAEQRRASALRAACPGLFRELKASADGASDPALPPALQPTFMPPSETVPQHLSMYALDAMLFEAAKPSAGALQGGRRGSWISLALDLEGVVLGEGGREVPGQRWKARVRADLLTEIAVALGLGEDEVRVEQLWRESGAGGGRQAVRALVLVLPHAMAALETFQLASSFVQVRACVRVCVCLRVCVRVRACACSR
jgi:hypothetical protein